MPLDPQAKEFLDMLAATRFPGFESMPIPVARALFLTRRDLGGPPVPVDQVEDRVLPGNIPARVYTPVGPGPKPVLLYFHGGGWVLGGLDTVDAPCRRLANAAGCVVVSVDYRLAPEHKFPIPAEDCYTATRHVAENAAAFGADRDRIAVGGDSAGGNLAAAVTLMARDRGGPRLSFQLLIYPATDFAFDTPSYRANAEGFGLTRKATRWYWSQYLPRPEDGTNPLASPLRARDLRGLPPARVITAEYDPLRDEGEAYAARLRAAGVRAEVRRFDGQIHGFFSMCGIMDQGKAAIDDAAAALREAWRLFP